jgi:trk system potassium uptake protein TrkA
VIVVGAGQVGSSIAESLADEHEVTVIDIDEERVDALTYDLDVLAIQGDGASLSTLREAGIEETDMVIASTDADEINIVTCGTAKTVGDPFTIARVKNTNYLETWEQAEGALGVDFMVGTNLLTAKAATQVIGLPAARDVDTFAGGRVQMAEFEVPEGSPICGQTVQEADRFDSLTFAAVIRKHDGEEDGQEAKDEVVIPTGATVIQAGDEVVVIGSSGSVQAMAAEIAPHASGASDVLVVGGSDIGYQVARLLERRGLRPRLIEQKPERARDLAEQLPDTTVLESDATDREFLEREHIDEVDAVVAALDSDEKNLLASLLAKRLGAGRAVAIVDDGAYVRLFEEVGVDVGINPREVTAEEITRFTRERYAENVALIESDRAEVIEFTVDEESVLAGRTIAESAADLPDGVVIGAIARGDDFVIPRGGTTVEVGDSVVVFVDTDVLDEATAAL